MDQHTIAIHLAVVEAHCGSEAAGRVAEAVALDPDEIVWEAPSRRASRIACTSGIKRCVTSSTAVFLDAQRRAAPAGHPSQGGRASASKAQGERS
jgi:hypothetical protein